MGGSDRQQEAKPGSFPPTRAKPGAFPPTRAVPAASIEFSNTSVPDVAFAASSFRSVPAGHQGMGERHRAHTSSAKMAMQGGAEMGGSMGPVAPAKVSMSMGRPAGPQERQQADIETPHTGAGFMRLSARQGRPASLPTPQAATRVPLDSTVPQGPTSPELSATPAITRPHRRKTTRHRAYCVICLENPQEMAIDPCGHLSMCEECIKSVKDCPICRGPIHKAMKIIIAKRNQSGDTTEYVSW